MNNFLFEAGSKIVFGSGCVHEYLAGFLEGYGPNVLLLTDGVSEENRAVDEVKRTLHCAGKQAAECAVGPICPRYEQVERAAQLCLEHRVDLILGIGGSAALDGCKAAALAAVCRGELWHDFFLCQGVVDIQPLPIGFVSTAVETGAIAGAAGMMRAERCVWRDYPACDPAFALLDPAYLRGLTCRELAEQGCSVLEGAMELYLQPAKGAHVSQELLETLIRRIIRDLRTCFRDPPADGARSDLMWESALWGNRFYQLGRRFSFPALPIRELALRVEAETGGEYAAALAVLLLAHCRREAREHPALLAQMAGRIWEIAWEGKTELQLAQACVAAMDALWKELRLPTEIGALSRAAQARLEQTEFSRNLLVYTA